MTCAFIVHFSVHHIALLVILGFAQAVILDFNWILPEINVKPYVVISK